MEQISIGNVLTMLTIIVGLAIQYVAIVTKFSERITKLETKYDSLKETLDKSDLKINSDINALFSTARNIIKDCEHVKGSSQY